MHKNHLEYIKNFLIPCLVFSSIAGIITAIIIFIFKSLATVVTALSGQIYGFIRENPPYLPLMIGAFALIGVIAALILKLAPECRGGGIPTAVAVLRGLIPLKWLKSVVLMPICALLTFLCGVPLGNEGPCVQMGTAVGNATVKMFGEKRRAWSRYIMTGGACAGFSVATGAPITGILFAVEEAHSRFSPLIFITAAVSVTASCATSELIAGFTSTSTSIFGFGIGDALPLKYLWTAIFVGIICGVCAIFFTRAYRLCSSFVKNVLERMHITFRFALLFAVTATLGFFSSELIGSGHSLIESVIDGDGIWYILLICFCVRAILLMLANNVGVTGGLFIPTLTFGAILGALCGKLFVFCGAIDERYFATVVIIGMSAFLGASSRTPITACSFAVEALGGLKNVLPIAAGVTVAYLVIEAVGIRSFNDTVMESKVEMRNAGHKKQVLDAYFTVREGAFAVRKEVRDILWPPSCVVISVKKGSNSSNESALSAGDVVCVHYSTCYPSETYSELEALLGRQSGA